MTRLILKANCGCGHNDRLEVDTDALFPSKPVKEFFLKAVGHSAREKHTLEFNGQVIYKND